MQMNYLHGGDIHFIPQPRIHVVAVVWVGSVLEFWVLLFAGVLSRNRNQEIEKLC